MTFRYARITLYIPGNTGTRSIVSLVPDLTDASLNDAVERAGFHPAPTVVSARWYSDDSVYYTLSE
jgi:hypothetical protein